MFIDTKTLANHSIIDAKMQDKLPPEIRLHNVDWIKETVVGSVVLYLCCRWFDPCGLDPDWLHWAPQSYSIWYSFSKTKLNTKQISTTLQSQLLRSTEKKFFYRQLTCCIAYCSTYIDDLPELVPVDRVVRYPVRLEGVGVGPIDPGKAVSFLIVTVTKVTHLGI